MSNPKITCVTDEKIAQCKELVRNATDNFTTLRLEFTVDATDFGEELEQFQRQAWHLASTAPLDRAALRAWKDAMEQAIFRDVSFDDAWVWDVAFEHEPVWQSWVTEDVAEPMAQVAADIAKAHNVTLELAPDLWEQLIQTASEFEDCSAWYWVEVGEDTTVEPVLQLLDAQGYTLADLQDPQRVSASKFLTSLQQARTSCPSPTPLLAALSWCPPNDLEDLLAAKQVTLTLDATSTVGLYDPAAPDDTWYEVELERAWTLTVDHTALHQAHQIPDDRYIAPLTFCCH